MIFSSKLYRCCLLLAVLLLPAAFSGRAQIGLQVNYMMPWGEYGMYFKRAPSYELYYAGLGRNEDAGWTTRMGFHYTAPATRRDTFTTWVYGGSLEHFMPGYIAISKFYMLGFFIDVEKRIRIVKGRLEARVGAGLMLGKVHQEDSYRIVGLEEGNNDIDNSIACIRSQAKILYHLNGRFRVYTEIGNRLVTAVNWEKQYHNNHIGLGLEVRLGDGTEREHD